MSLFVIADLHLSLSENKSMEVFGCRWQAYVQKLESAWRAAVTDYDTVVIPGDISWGMSMEEARADLAFVNALPGKKILGKGNHDYWWQTQKKLTEFCAENGFSTLSFLYNNAIETQRHIVCGSRGWWNDEKTCPAEADYQKIIAREVQRLQLSLDAGAKRCAETGKPPLVFLHFPPVFRTGICPEIVELLHRYQIRHVWFGHIHGQYDLPPSYIYEGITFTIVSADYLNFSPLRIEDSPQIPNVDTF